MSKKSNKTRGLPRIGGFLLPSPENRLIQQGKIAFKNGDLTSAISQWEMARQMSPLSQKKQQINGALAEAYFRRGQLTLFKNETQALKDLTTAAELKPGDALYAFHTGLAEHRYNHIEKAIGWYRQALQRDPNFKRAYYPLAIALSQRGIDVTQDPVWQLLDAVQRAYLTRIPSGDPLTQALAHMENGKDPLPLLTQALTDKTPPLAQGIAHYYLGVQAQRIGDSQGALEHWRKAFDVGIDNPWLRGNLGIAYTIRAEALLSEGKSDESTLVVKRGLEAVPGNKRLFELNAYLQMQAGYAAAEQGNWEGALAAWAKVGQITGLNGRNLAANRAIAYEKLGRLPEAAEAWRDFVKRRARSEDSEFWLSSEQVARLWGRISGLYIKAGKPEEAISTLQTAIKYQPDDPALGLTLAHCYAEAERLEAASNQVDRVLKNAPNHVEALVFRAELAEANFGRGMWVPEHMQYIRAPLGVREWETVLATNDEAYVPVAKQRLGELYEQQLESSLFWKDTKSAIEQLRHALERLPDNHYLRARFAQLLLSDKKKEKEAREQIALIDLSDWDAAHQLVDMWHKAGKHAEAVKVITQADALKTLTPQFFTGVAGCALSRKQYDIAQGYYDEAIRRAPDEETKNFARADMATAYMDNDMATKAKAVLEAILKTDRNFGPAHFILATFHAQREEFSIAKRHLRDAERWAKAKNATEMLETIRRIRMMLDSPFGSILGGGRGIAPPPDFFDDDDEEAASADEISGWIDILDALDNQPSYDPQSDRRRRRQNKRK